MLVVANDMAGTVEIGTLQSLVSLGVILVSVGAAWGTLKAALKGIADTVKKIERNVDKLKESITEHKADITGLKVHTKYGVTNSPTVPSDEGRRVLDESGFTAQYPRLKAKLFALLDKRKPRTLYDYEVQAYEALEELKDDPVIDPLKDYAVNHPHEPLELIFKIASWVIRDDYAAYRRLERHDRR